jgi:hypothetical protein
MGNDSDVQFLAGNGGTLPEPEPPPRPRVNRRTAIGGLLAVMLVAAAGTSLRHNGNHAPKARETPAPSVSRSAESITEPVPADAVRLPAGGPPLDIAGVGRRLYVLQQTRFSMLDTDSLRTIASADVGGPDLAGWQRIVVDPSGQRVWIVTLANGPSLILELDGRTLARIRTASWTSSVTYAAGLDGDLYFTSPQGIAVLRSGDTQPRVLIDDRATGPLTTDPSRHRLLLLHLGNNNSDVSALSTSGKVLRTAPLGLPKADIAVTGSTIWVAGFGRDGAVVHTLDPDTLRGSGNLQPAPQLGPGAILAASGQSTVWLRSGGVNSDVLWCRDVHGGVASWWTADGHVASVSGAAFVADQTALRVLRLVGSCA